jgi:hypothetical protein
VKGTHATILMRWIIDLYSSVDHVVFECQTNHIWAHVRKSNIRVKCHVTNGIFYLVVEGVEVWRSEITTKFVVELHMFSTTWGISYCLFSLLVAWWLWWIWMLLRVCLYPKRRWGLLKMWLWGVVCIYPKCVKIYVQAHHEK